MEIKFDSYRNVLAIAPPRIKTLAEYLSEVRRHNHLFVKGTEEYKEYKRHVECIAVNGKFSFGRSYHTFERSTGFLFADVDDTRIKDNVDQMKNHYFNTLPFIITAYKSMSGTGMHFFLSISERLQTIINNTQGRCIPDMLETISNKYFDSLLDKSAAKVTQPTTVGKDKFPLHRDNILVSQALDFDYVPKTLDTTKTSKALELDLMASMYEENHNSFAQFEFLKQSYPDIFERSYYHNRPVADADVNNLLIWYDDIVAPRSTNKPYRLKTTLSDQYFLDQSVIYPITFLPEFVFDRRIPTQTINMMMKSKVGKRRKRLFLEATKVLHINPHLSLDQYISNLHFWNNERLYNPPLNAHDVEEIAKLNFISFHAGRMRFPKPLMKLTFYPEVNYTNIEPYTKDEKRTISLANHHAFNLQQNIARYLSILEDYSSRGFKLTVKQIADIMEVTDRTIYRIRKELKDTDITT